MPSDLPQRKARKFLSEHLQSQAPFTRQQLQQFAGWTKKKTFDTYWSKQIKPFVVDVGGGQFRVSEAFRPYLPWKRFQRHVTQVRPVAADYQKTEYERVIIYEFFMPLTNEAALRSTLDALFFKDNVVPKLKAIGLEHLDDRIARTDGEGDDDYLDRLCVWIGNHFGGYSIYHVDGRFLGGPMLTREDAAAREQTGQRYLVDETTAVTRFIFPCETDEEAELVRYFFNELFVQTIIQLINAEDQIWMVESGMRNRVHIWRVEASDDDGGYDEGAAASPEADDSDSGTDSDE
jgi:hypothetical protein